MAALVPPQFLFRYSLPVLRAAGLPKRGRKLLGLTPKHQLPYPAELEGATPFGDVRAGWNSEGFGISVEVSGRTGSLECNPRNPTESDGLQVWIDTRNTQTIHRASRFCHHFCLLPASKSGAAEKPVVRQLEIARSREETSLTGEKAVSVSVTARKDGYLLEAWLPGDALTGFDPDANPRFGFYYYLRDSELGDQFLSVGHEFPFDNDPSLWSTLELV